MIRLLIEPDTDPRIAVDHTNRAVFDHHQMLSIPPTSTTQLPVFHCWGRWEHTAPLVGGQVTVTKPQR